MSDEKAGLIALALMLLLWAAGMIYFSGKPVVETVHAPAHVHTERAK